MKLTPEALKVRQRLRDDYSFYSEHALKIRNKDGEIVPLKLNEAQQRLTDLINKQMEAEGRVRIIILKARQMGLSTAVGAWIYWWISQRKAQKAIVMTHKADSTAALFNMTKRFHENVPHILKPSTKYSSKKELAFDILDSGYAIATAGGEGVGRGETFNVAHLSELAFWPKGKAQEILSGLLDAIPNRPGSAVFIESTANGVSGPFYEMWKGACEGTNGYLPIFLPWFIQDEYREPVSANFKRTPEEEDLCREAESQYGIVLDNEQLTFRRKKVAEKGLDLFKQEYPSNPEEAFLTTGRPVFNPIQLEAMKAHAPDPIYTMALENGEFVKHPRGELVVFAERSPTETYYIGADVAMGVQGGDYSVAQVLDSKKRQVAVWRGHVHPDYYATVLKHLGEYYNMARIIVESNNHGILTVTRLGKDMAYPNFFTEEVEGKLTDKDTQNLGFRTSVKTKPLIIDQLRAALRDGELSVFHRTTIEEMRTYIVTETGSMEAEEGCHDDCVMALAMANYIHDGVFTPIESTDDFYIETI